MRYWATLTKGGTVAAPRQLGDNPWLVTAIADEDGDLEPVIEETSPYISFEEDGQAVGDGSCNRFFGPYETDDPGHWLVWIELTSPWDKHTLMVNPDALDHLFTFDRD